MMLSTCSRRKPGVALSLLVLSLFSTAPAWAGTRAITAGDLWRMQRVAQPAASPDGRWIAFTVTTFDAAANASGADLWLVATDARQSPRRLTGTGANQSAPFWHPGSRRIGFVQGREGEAAQFSTARPASARPGPIRSSATMARSPPPTCWPRSPHWTGVATSTARASPSLAAPTAATWPRCCPA
jgi:hypothetical protein